MIFLAVLQRLFDPGSDRACFEWKDDYLVDGVEELSLHHSYRAMAWLGEVLPEADQEAAMPWAPRCVKDLVEERLFARRRDLFSDLELVFFDTTSIYFEGEGGESLGQRGHSKDKRPDLKQMVVGAVIDQQGRPICCELWPGNTADVKTLIPVAERMKRRFGIERICLVADRGMIQKKTLDELEERGWPYILGARMRTWKEVRETVLSRAGRYREVHPERTATSDPSPLRVKEVRIDERRYVVCLNPEQERKDAADREAILATLEEQLRQGPKSLVGNRGFRKYLRGNSGAFTIDEAKIRQEARYDGKWVLRTNTELDAAQVALKYKQLWMVEDLFRNGHAEYAISASSTILDQSAEELRRLSPFKAPAGLSDHRRRDFSRYFIWERWADLLLSQLRFLYGLWHEMPLPTHYRVLTAVTTRVEGATVAVEGPDHRSWWVGALFESDAFHFSSVVEKGTDLGMMAGPVLGRFANGAGLELEAAFDATGQVGKPKPFIFGS